MILFKHQRTGYGWWSNQAKLVLEQFVLFCTGHQTDSTRLPRTILMRMCTGFSHGQHRTARSHLIGSSCRGAPKQMIGDPQRCMEKNTRYIPQKIVEVAGPLIPFLSGKSDAEVQKLWPGSATDGWTPTVKGSNPHPILQGQVSWASQERHPISSTLSRMRSSSLPLTWQPRVLDGWWEIRIGDPMTAKGDKKVRGKHFRDFRFAMCVHDFNVHWLYSHCFHYCWWHIPFTFFYPILLVSFGPHWSAMICTLTCSRQEQSPVEERAVQFNDGDEVSGLEALGAFLHPFIWSSVSSHFSHHFSFQRFQGFLVQLTLLRLFQCQVGHHASFGGSEDLLRVVIDYVLSLLYRSPNL